MKCQVSLSFPHPLNFNSNPIPRFDICQMLGVGLACSHIKGEIMHDRGDMVVESLFDRY
jgi:hypothetical protein